MTDLNPEDRALIEVRYHRKRDGVLRIEPDSQGRFLTFLERLIFMLGGRP